MGAPRKDYAWIRSVNPHYRLLAPRSAPLGPLPSRDPARPCTHEDAGSRTEALERFAGDIQHSIKVRARGLRSCSMGGIAARLSHTYFHSGLATVYCVL